MSFARTALLLLSFAAPLATQAAVNPFNNQESDAFVSTATRAQVQAERIEWNKTHTEVDGISQPVRSATAAPTRTRAEVRAEALQWRKTHGTQDTWIDPRAATVQPLPAMTVAAMAMSDR